MSNCVQLILVSTCRYSHVHDLAQVDESIFGYKAEMMMRIAVREFLAF